MALILRPYQRRALDELYAWFIDGNEGHPCIVMPTGSGKSHVIAQLCKEAIQLWPDQRILMATHVKELILQNAGKMFAHWEDVPLGIYSAGLNIRELDESITFGSVQSLHRIPDRIGHIDLMIVDEAHLVNHANTGMYRKLIDALTEINPRLRVVGLTATAYRLGHGMITDGDALFSGVIEPVTMEELIHKGFLCTLRSKQTKKELDVNGVRKRGGEFIESELQRAVDTDSNNESIIAEIISRAGDRTSWLLFGAGVDHATHLCDILRRKEVPAACIFGSTPARERADTFEAYRAGRIKALCGANVFTTGFDAPNVDLIAMVRPTESPGLYVQMVGRGMRVKEHTDHCLVLDFAGNIKRHGPITNITPPSRKGDGTGEAPVKVCDHCDELCHAACKECPCCGKPFPEPARPAFKLHDDDVMGKGGCEFDVTAWQWRKHIGYRSQKAMLMVKYYGKLSQTPIAEYFPLTHDGYAAELAARRLAQICSKSGLSTNELKIEDLQDAANALTKSKPPTRITYKKEGKFHRVISREWESDDLSN